jgi:hypothetical protein
VPLAASGDYELYESKSPFFPSLGLGVQIWQGTGTYEDMSQSRLRWTNVHGQILPTGKELACFEAKRADEERSRAEEAERIVEQLQEELRLLRRQ